MCQCLATQKAGIDAARAVAHSGISVRQRRAVKTGMVLHEVRVHGSEDVVLPQLPRIVAKSPEAQANNGSEECGMALVGRGNEGTHLNTCS